MLKVLKTIVIREEGLNINFQKLNNQKLLESVYQDLKSKKNKKESAVHKKRLDIVFNRIKELEKNNSYLNEPESLEDLLRFPDDAITFSKRKNSYGFFDKPQKKISRKMKIR